MTTVTVVTFTITEKTAADWIAPILEAIPEEPPQPDPVPNMDLAGCARMLTWIAGSTVVLAVEWKGDPEPGGCSHDEYVKWWATKSGWRRYAVQGYPDKSAIPGNPVVYEPDVNGRPCLPPTT